jgi:hypothetical protein
VFLSLHSLRFILNDRSAYKSKFQKSAKPPCATLYLTPKPCANFSQAARSPSCGVSVRCGRSKFASRYAHPPFTTTRCLLKPIYFTFKILKESQLRDDNLHPFANRARAVSLRRRHSPSSDL